MVNSTEVFVAIGVCVAVTGVIYIITVRKKREHEREQEVKRKQKQDSDKKEEIVSLVSKTENLDDEVTKQPESNNELKIAKEPVEIKKEIKSEIENLEFQIPELLAKINNELGNDTKPEVLVVEVSKEEVKADSNEFSLKLPESLEIINDEPKAEPIIENEVLTKSEAVIVEAIKEEPKLESSSSEALGDDIEVIEEKEEPEEPIVALNNEEPKAPEIIAEAEKVDTENKIEPKIENEVVKKSEAVIVEAVKVDSNPTKVVNEVVTETVAPVEAFTATEHIEAPVVNNEEPKLEANITTEKVEIEKVDIKEEPKSENEVVMKSEAVIVEATKEEPKLKSRSSEALGDDIEVISEKEVSEVPLVASNNEEPKVEASKTEPIAENVETKTEQDINMDNSAQPILQTIIKKEPSVNEVAAASNSEEPKVESVETKTEQDANNDNSAQTILQTIMKISSSVNEEAKVEIVSNETINETQKTPNQEEIKTVEPIQQEKL